MALRFVLIQVAYLSPAGALKALREVGCDSDKYGDGKAKNHGPHQLHQLHPVLPGVPSQEREPEDFRDFDLDWMRCGITGQVPLRLGPAHEGPLENDVSTVEDLRDCEDTTVKQKSYIRVLPTVKQCLWAFVPLNMFCLFPSLKLHSDACNWVHWQAAYASVIQWRECDLERSRFIKMFFNGCRNGKFISNDFYIAWFSYLWLRTISGQLQDVSNMTVKQVPGRAHKLSGEFFVGQRLTWPRCCRDQSNYFWAAWSLGIHETPRTPRTPRSQEFEDTQMSRINESRQTRMCQFKPGDVALVGHKLAPCEL